MFCKNCGSEMVDGDRFCGSCGQDQSGGVGNSTGFVQPIRVKDSGLIKLFKNYFIKPLSFFSELKGEDLVKTAVSLFVGLPIIYGLLNMLYTSTLINSAFSMLKKLPNILANAKIISEKQAIEAGQELMMSSEVLQVKSRINALIDNKEVFFSGASQVLVIIITTAIILGILNAIILKNKIKLIDIIFISTASYIPLVLSMGLASVATFVSIIFGLLILASGYILSFITLYSGIRQISEEKNDKIFILMTILFISISAILSILVVMRAQSSLAQMINIVNNFKGLY
jgi:hypothetical protein